MKLSLKKLNQQGFDHVVGLVVFVVLFAGIGTYLLVASHAATPEPVLFLGSNNSGTCLNEYTGAIVTDTTCNNSSAQKYSYNLDNSEIDLSGGCVAVEGASPTSLLGQNQLYVVSNSSCSSTPYGAAWTQVHVPNGSSNEYMFENKHADSKGGSYCLTASGSKVSLASCVKGGATSQDWFAGTYTAGSGATTSPPPVTSSTNCPGPSSESVTYGQSSQAADINCAPGHFGLVSGSAKLTFQPDGNLVLYNGSKAVWETNTNGKLGAGGHLELASNGNVIIWKGATASSGKLWQSNTGYGAYCSTHGAGISDYQLSVSQWDNSSGKIISPIAVIQVELSDLYAGQTSAWQVGYGSADFSC